MTRRVLLILFALSIAPIHVAAQDEPLAAVHSEPAAPEVTRTPRTPIGMGSWIGLHLDIGYGTEGSREHVDLLPSLDYSFTSVDGNLRASHRLTYGVRELNEQDDPETTSTAQTLRSEWGLTWESDAGPYVGARIGFAYTWDLLPDASGRTDRLGMLLALDAGLNFRLDRSMRLGLGLSYVVEPETGGQTVLIGLQAMTRMFDV